MTELRRSGEPPSTGDLPGGLAGVEPLRVIERLDALLSLGRSLRSEALSDPTASEVFRAALGALAEVAEVDAFALYALDDDGLGFSLADAEPAEVGVVLDAVVERLQGDGTFGWCLTQNRAVCLPVEPGDLAAWPAAIQAPRAWLVHPLATRAGVQGCLLGGLRTSVLPDLAQKLVSMIVFECASTLELGALHRRLAAAHRELEAKVEERTAELSEALSRAQAAEHAKGRFLASMSHEMRTPLTGIIGMSDLALEMELGRTQREYLEIVHSAGQGLLQLVDDVLDFSKADEGQIRLEAIPFDLRTTLEQTVDLVAERAHRKGIELGLSVAPGLPRQVVGDPGRVRQIVLNLLGNAIKFTTEGQVILSVRCVEEHTQAARVRIEVQDSGIGITPEQGERLFRPFSQADTSTTRRFGGTGLGLSISRQLAELMGGRVYFKSEPGEGSTFFLELALGLPAPAAPGLEPPRRTTSSSLVGRRALVIEPNAPLSRLMVDSLAALGIVAVAAPSPAETEAQTAAAPPFDLVFADHRIDEGRVLDLPAARWGSITDAALVLMTSYARRGDAGEAERRGWHAFLTKPIKQAILEACVREVLGRSTPAVPPGRGAEPHARRPIVTRHYLLEVAAVQRPRVLVADDNPVNRTLVSVLLGRLGAEADVVTNGVEAVEAVRSASYDLVLMDWHMPELDGLEAARAIRAWEAGGRRVPIVALTANVLEDDRQACLDAGMDEYLTKPIRREALALVLQRFARRD